MRREAAKCQRSMMLRSMTLVRSNKVVFLFLLLIASTVFAQVSTSASPGDLPLAAEGKTARLVVESTAWPGVARAAHDLAEDVQAVSGMTPAVESALPHSGDIVLVATVGRSPLLDRLSAQHKIDLAPLRGQWEATLAQTIAHPFPGIHSALVIAGSDKRGAIFGVYDVSRQIGVSPWYWWADVPIPHKAAIYLPPGRVFTPSPAIKYRGIFLNDEAPALSGMVHEKFGNFTSEFYVHVFTLLLRLRANFLWPAMWANAFNEDDPANPKLADEYGIVMSTSHHEPMMRAQQEWKRHGTGPWDYTTNATELQKFWREGVRRNKDYEELTTIGMRGDGDIAMSASTNTALLERIVKDQREILSEEMNPDVTKVPQVWALYKEVQGYYEAGMRRTRRCHTALVR
jgi:Glycosyl hydrolase family 115